MDRKDHGGSVTALLAEPAPESAVDLDSMTKNQLLAYAADHGIEGVSSAMLKADILAAIKAGV